VGPGVLGFLACGSVVRTSAYLEVGGFHSQFGIGGEETLLALDLTAAGWQCCHADDVVARHFPIPGPRSAARRRRQARNALWTAWLRRRPTSAVAESLRVLRAGEPQIAVAALRDAAAGLRWVRAERRPVNRSVERDLARLTPC
jgi:GT2 family glycosyltransferase